jgi:hypothetical protein
MCPEKWLQLVRLEHLKLDGVTETPVIGWLRKRGCLKHTQHVCCGEDRQVSDWLIERGCTVEHFAHVSKAGEVPAIDWLIKRLLRSEVTGSFLLKSRCSRSGITRSQ